tara:strand:- start:3101 stop:3313 length:213 start_codon:yes stop_codon:yes gene_type:complete
MINVGDLVYLDNVENIGIVIKVQEVKKLELTPPLLDVKVLWAVGQVTWCLGEAITVIASAKDHSPSQTSS